MARTEIREHVHHVVPVDQAVVVPVQYLEPLAHLAHLGRRQSGESVAVVQRHRSRSLLLLRRTVVVVVVVAVVVLCSNHRSRAGGAAGWGKRWVSRRRCHGRERGSVGDAEAAGRPAAGWGERGRRGILELGGRGEGVLLLGLRRCGSV